jgi:5-(hydroxymethyl)furfural/furfural oxidase
MASAEHAGGIPDYLIVGAGAAGSVLANRLSALAGKHVLLIEAGPDIQPGHEPADIRNVFPLSSFNENYHWRDLRIHWREAATSPAIPFPQGRIVGGSSNINGMWALRGTPNDFDGWAEAGADGWAWRDVLPFFVKLENDRDFDGPLHGRAGPVEIRRQPRNEWSPMAEAVYQALLRKGWHAVSDMNADFRDGCGVLPLSMFEHSRASAGICYLTAEVRARPNLHIMTDTTVERLLFEGSRAVGVMARRADGSALRLEAREVILAAGALQTPFLMLRSGIGPGAELQSRGVAVLKDAPGVGNNLQNHPLLLIACFLKRGGRESPGWKPAGSTYMRWSTGLAGCEPSDMSMYVRSYVTWHALGRRMASLCPVLGRPASRGQVRLSKDGPDALPCIEFNLLSDPRDVKRMVDAFRLAGELFDATELRPICEEAFVLTKPAGLMRFNRLSAVNALRGALAAAVADTAPGYAAKALERMAGTRPVKELLADEAALAAFVRSSTAGAGHMSGTCRMGAAGDPLAVTDNCGRVRGVDALRVADASIMPNVPSGNTHIPVVMVAEKIAAMMAERAA